MPRSRKQPPVGRGQNALKPQAGMAFEAETLPVLCALAKALGSLIRKLPDPVTGPRELERALGVDYMLAWRAYTVATAQEPGAIARAVPRPVPMERLLKASARRRVPDATIQRVRKAYVAFEEAVRRHAGEDLRRGRGGGRRVGGRGAFDALMGGVHPSAGQNLGLVNRRAAFKANSYEWGVQEHAHLMATIYHRGDGEQMVDSALISGFVGLHATRKNAVIRLFRRAASMNAADAFASKPPLPYSDSTILEEFSSSPMPCLDQSINPAGMRETGLTFDEIGKAAAVDVFLASTGKDLYESRPQPWFGTSSGISSPQEVVVMDILVPAGWTDPSTVRASRHGHVGMYEAVAARVPEFAMPMTESAAHLGTDRRALHAPEIPRYPEIVQHMLEKLGWAQTEFDLYRVRVPYPTLHSWVFMRIDAARR